MVVFAIFPHAGERIEIISNAFVHSDPFVRLHLMDWKRTAQNQLFHEFQRAGGAAFLVHFTETPARTFVHSGILVVFSAVYDARRRYIFHVNLYLLFRILRSDIRIRLVFLMLLLCWFRLHSFDSTQHAFAAAGITLFREVCPTGGSCYPCSKDSTSGSEHILPVCAHLGDDEDGENGVAGFSKSHRIASVSRILIYSRLCTVDLLLLLHISANILLPLDKTYTLMLYYSWKDNSFGLMLVWTLTSYHF